MELRLTSRLDSIAASACEAYLDRLPLSPEEKRGLRRHLRSETDPTKAMALLHQRLAGGPTGWDNPALGSIRRRLELAYRSSDENESGLAAGLHDRARLVTTPPIHRTPMAPSAWPSALAVRLVRTVARWIRGQPEARRDRDRGSPDAAHPGRRWKLMGAIRRTVLMLLVLGQTATAAYVMTGVLPYHARQPLEIAILSLFIILFGWVSVGFWTGVVGCLVLLLHGDRYAISRSAPQSGPIAPDARTAVIMPICNEHVGRVFAGLRATYESLAQTGALDRFAFFVLSDSSEPDARVAETKAWLDLCCTLGGFDRIFYRWRRHRIKRKSGNVADFCRRWGSQYRYMVVLDADSIMSGECLTALVRLMEANPNAGIIQTAPQAAGRETLYARIQQFATRVYGPVFTAGLHFWQLGESYYWGHNAIIRIAPFIRHCALGRLPGWGTLSGEILSHDFVEAALIRRAGWAVWMAYDLPGSYEEMPPNLIDELKRDRRWCRGNMINSRLFLMEGLHPAHRAVFVTGVMAYLSAPLWLLSLGLSTVLIAVQTLIGPQYFVQPRQLFPLWPEWHLSWAIGLLTATGTVLFLPKILSALFVLAQGARHFGGAARLTLSLVAELLFSALLAPIRMAFHSQFVIAALCGWPMLWKSPAREDAETTWGEASRRHGLHTGLGVLWAIGVYWLDASFFWWLTPVVGALALSIPISVYTSRVSLGRRLRKAKLFLIPEETRPPHELRSVRRYLNRPITPPRFTDAVVDPVVNALVCAAAVTRPARSPARQSVRQRLILSALHDGSEALTSRQQLLLLSEPPALSQLHFAVWTSSAAHPSWRGDPALRP